MSKSLDTVKSDKCNAYSSKQSMALLFSLAFDVSSCRARANPTVFCGSCDNFSKDTSV